MGIEILLLAVEASNRMDIYHECVGDEDAVDKAYCLVFD